MKKNSASNIFCTASLLLLIAVCPILLKAQEKKNQITISVIAAHYDETIYKNDDPSWTGYYEFPIDPGVEICYLRKLFENVYAGTGLDLQKGRFSYFIAMHRRFKFEELSLPVLISFNPKIDHKNGFIVMSGLYWGKFLRVKTEDPGKTDVWHEIPNMAFEHYSSDIYFSDVYFSVGYYHIFPTTGKLSINPFIKYRTNTTWLNYYEKKTHYGVKLTYSLDF